MAFWRKHLPDSIKGYVHYLKTDVKKLIGGYFLAQFRIMFVVAVILIVGFLILGDQVRVPDRCVGGNP